MKKLSNLLVFFAVFAAMIGLLVAAVSFFDRKRGLFCDDDYEDELYGGQEYYSEDISFDTQTSAEAEKTDKSE